MYSYWLASSPQKVSGDCCHLLAKGFKMTGKLGNIFTWETSTKFKPTASFGLRFSEIKMWAPDSGNVLIFSESWRVSSILKAAFHQPLKEVGLITFTESTVVNIIYSYQMSTFWWWWVRRTKTLLTVLECTQNEAKNLPFGPPVSRRPGYGGLCVDEVSGSLKGCVNVSSVKTVGGALSSYRKFPSMIVF